MQQPCSTIRPPLEIVTGTVERGTFRSEDTGLSVLRIQVKGHRDLVTVVSTVPEVRTGEWLEAQGVWVVDPTRGRKLVVIVGAKKAVAMAVKQVDSRRQVAWSPLHRCNFSHFWAEFPLRLIPVVAKDSVEPAGSSPATTE